MCESLSLEGPFEERAFPRQPTMSKASVLQDVDRNITSLRKATSQASKVVAAAPAEGDYAALEAANAAALAALKELEKQLSRVSRDRRQSLGNVSCSESFAFSDAGDVDLSLAQGNSPSLSLGHSQRLLSPVTAGSGSAGSLATPRSKAYRAVDDSPASPATPDLDQAFLSKYATAGPKRSAAPARPPREAPRSRAAAPEAKQPEHSATPAAAAPRSRRR